MPTSKYETRLVPPIVHFHSMESPDEISGLEKEREDPDDDREDRKAVRQKFRYFINDATPRHGLSPSEMDRTNSWSDVLYPAI